MPSNAMIIGTVAIGVCAAALIDLKTRRVPNALTLALAASGLLVAVSGSHDLTVASSLAGSAVGLVLMLPGHIFGATGAGDVKLLAAVGSLVGPRQIATAFLYTLIAGGVIALIVALKRGLLRHMFDRVTEIVVTRRTARSRDQVVATVDTRFAYAPAIAVGAILAVLGL